jgi:hypothetical protein
MNQAKRAREESGTVEVVCSNGTVYVLDAAAAARSEFFAAGCSSGMRDAARIMVSGDPERVGQLVAFLLRGRVPNWLNTADAIEILELADYYGVHDLVALCLEYLARAVSEATALTVFLATTKFGGLGARSNAATLLGRALGAVMLTPEFLELGEVESVLGDAEVVPFASQMRLEAGLAWANHALGRDVPKAATRELGGLPPSVIGAFLQQVAELPGVVRSLGSALVVRSKPRNAIDFALVILNPCGRVFALDMRTREIYEMPPIPRAGGPCDAVYDPATRKILVFQLERGAPYEYCLESGESRALPSQPVEKLRAAYVCDGGTVYCIGGETAHADHSTTVTRMRIGEDRWELFGRMRAARSSCAATLVHGAGGASIVVFGGNQYEDECPAERIVLGGEGGWQECKAWAPHRDESSIACVNSDVFVVGGRSIFDQDDLGSLGLGSLGLGSLVFDVEEAHTRALPDLAPFPCARAVTVRGEAAETVWVFGHEDHAPNVRIYDPKRGTCEETRVPEFTRGSAVVFVPRAALP